MTRVAYLGHTAELSGGELALARLLPALRGVDPVVVLAEDGPLVERFRRDGVRVVVIPLRERTAHLRRDRIRIDRLPFTSVVDSFLYSWSLRRFLRTERIRLVHTNTLKAALYGGLAGRLAGIPVVWHIRDRIADDYLPITAVHTIRLLARVLPSAVIVNSSATRAALFPKGASLDRVATVPSAAIPRNGHGSESGSIVVVHDAAQPVDHGEPVERDHPLTIALIGRLAPWKGQDVFLRAFAIAFPDGDARARIVGSAMFGEEEWGESLRVMAASLGISDRVDFVGFVEDVDAEYARADIAVHASTVPEPFGQVVVEAMAAGVPIIAANAGGPTEIVTSGVDGLLTPMGDVEALAAAMKHLASDPDLRAKFAEAGLRRIADFAPERVAAKVERVYAAILARRNGAWRSRI